MYNSHSTHSICSINSVHNIHNILQCYREYIICICIYLQYTYCIQYLQVSPYKYVQNNTNNLSLSADPFPFGYFNGSLVLIHASLACSHQIVQQVEGCLWGNWVNLNFESPNFKSYLQKSGSILKPLLFPALGFTSPLLIRSCIASQRLCRCFNRSKG